MLARLHRWLGRIPATDPFERRTAVTVQAFFIGLSTLLFLNEAIREARGVPIAGLSEQFGVAADVLSFVVSVLAIVLLRRGRIRAGYALALTGYVSILATSLILRGLAYHEFLLVRVFSILLVLAALLLGRRALWSTLGSILVAMAVGRARDLGMFAGTGPLAPPAPPFGIWGQAVAVMLLLCLILDRFGATLTEAYTVALQRQREAEAANHHLRDAKDSLEDEMERRMQAEALLYQAQKQESIGRLSGGVAHDFNNLLTAILGFAHLTHGELAADDHRRRHLEGIMSAAQRGAGLTRQLLAFARKQIVTPQPVQLEDRIRELEPMLRRLIGEPVRIEMALDPAPIPVLIDPGQLDQVLVNLAVNARDAMPDGGTMRFSTSRMTLDVARRVDSQTLKPGEYVRLLVSDTGHGMDRHTLDNLFEPFFTTKAVGKGTGLGLATCQGIVRQADGSITATSTPGRGSTFEILLPVTHEHATAEPAVRAIAPRGGAERILVLEDDPLVLDLVLRVLSAHGYDAHGVADPVNALRWVRQHPEGPDLLLSDVVLPAAGGLTFADTLVREHPETAVLFMSGHADDIVVRHGVLGPGMAFLSKPFSPAALIEKVRDTLDRRRALA